MENSDDEMMVDSRGRKIGILARRGEIERTIVAA